ncbi:28 kDa ribonucleo, chloroplastic-like [Olea europaea subsp. europaea]|uniref:28 kDa ribonucleo, chloroplastic-like n=1 Tax=Olea europaea subsp. europaea TaxID=158383 RepID=A0A8S0SHA6_OLEEU|nr:28 kDa ribonucleo, chloroplastic-like [Olea europaea subsp. europaea]
MAAVTQEEMVKAALVEEEENGYEETIKGKATECATVNTKLYFGNLPYHCDSAQLARFIQEYASPELVEVAEFQDLIS